MKLKAQIEILKDKTTHYKTKYKEIDPELITEIRKICPKETQQFLIELWEKLQKGGRKILIKKTTWLKNLPQKRKK